jgi:hypothetical protein
VTDPAQVSRLRTAAASAMAAEVAALEWHRARLRVNSVGGLSEAAAELHRRDGGAEAVAAPTEAVSRMLDLRELMAADGHGAWLSATLTLTRTPTGPLDFTFDFDYDSRPSWQIEPDDRAYVEDLARHPRPPEEVPGWYPSIA